MTAEGTAFPVVALIFLSPLTLWIVRDEIRHRRIGNLSVLGVFVAFAFSFAIGQPPSDLPLQFGAAAAVGSGGFLLWRRGNFGGGDVKLASALTLFVPVAHLGAAFSLLVALCIGTVLAQRIQNLGRKIFVPNRSTLPFGIPLVLTTLIVLAANL